MPSPAEPLASLGVREAIDLRRFPWIRPLVTAYAHDYAKVAPLFAGDPSDPEAWRAVAGRVTRAPRDRAGLAAALARQLTARVAPPEAQAAAAQFGDSGTVAVVTGQQAGLFGGPLYTLLKAVTAIQLARRLRDQRIAAVPVFWVEAEDHDWAEVRSTKVIDREGAVAAVTAADVPGAGSLPVARLTFDAGIAQTLSELRDRLPATEFTDETIASLEHRYRAGAPVGRAFAGWIEDLLGRHGLVVFEADDPTLKPVVRDLFAHELAGRPAARLAREQAGVMRSLGHAPQVETTEDGVSVFYVDAAGRRAIRVKDGQYLVGDQLRPVEDVRAEALDHPERFSPNVLLRPLVQDRLFPTACYVGGPAELAYQAQIGPLYREFGVEAPLLYSRGSATIVDGGAARFLDRSGLPLESLQPQDDGTLNRLLQEHLPGGVERTLAEINEIIATRVTALGQAVSPIDPTLSGAVDTTAERMRETLKTLQNKIVQAAKRKDETLRRQFTRTRALVFPDGDPQERALGIAFFVNRYGPALGDRLLDVLPVETDKHYVLVL